VSSLATQKPVEKLSAIFKAAAELAGVSINEYHDLRARKFPAVCIYWDEFRTRSSDLGQGWRSDFAFSVVITVDHPDFAAAMDELMALTIKVLAIIEQQHQAVTWVSNIAIEIENVETGAIFDFEPDRKRPNQKPICHQSIINFTVVEDRPPGTTGY
jgi:hypothetical protein